MEIWKKIEGFEFYEISNMGNLRSYWNNRHNRKEEPHLIKPWRLNHGHLVVSLSTKETKNQRFLIHRLVAAAFLDKPDDMDVVDHIDRNPSNNSVENLRWGTQCDNMANVGVSKNNKCGEKNICKNKNKWVFQLMRKGETVRKSFDTVEEAINFRNNFYNK